MYKESFTKDSVGSDMYNLNNQLEVIVRKEQTKFRAMCPAFPRCFGLGESEKIALKKLSKSIARRISKITAKKVEDVFLSDNYSEIIYDSQKNKTEQRKIYNLNSTLKTVNNSIALKIKTDLFDNLDNTLKHKEKLVDCMVKKNNPFNEEGYLDKEFYMPERISQEQEEAFYFDFPISFN